MANKNDIEGLYKEYHSSLRDFIVHKTGSLEIAHDIVQDVFLKLISDVKIQSVQKPKSFLYRMAMNLIIDRWRKNKNQERHSSLEDHVNIPHNGAISDQILSGKQELEKFKIMVEELSDKSREILFLKKIEGLSLKEIAQKMKMSESAVEKQLVRTMLFCRTKFYHPSHKKRAG